MFPDSRVPRRGWAHSIPPAAAVADAQRRLTRRRTRRPHPLPPRRRARVVAAFRRAFADTNLA
eukprot:7109641-Prymnesium_polylepis.1